MFRWIAACLACTTLLAHASDTPAPVPVEAFYRAADIESYALSPSGKRLAVASSAGAPRTSLAVFDLVNGAEVKVAARYVDIDVDDFRWVNDDLLVYSVTDKTRGGGDQRYASGLFSVRADGTDRRQLVKLHNAFVSSIRAASARDLLEWNHQLLFVPQTGGTEVIVGQYEYNAQRDLVRIVPIALDVVTRATRSLGMGSPEGATHWWFTPRGEPRIVGSIRDGHARLYRRAAGQDEWQQFAEFDALNRPYWPAQVDGAENLYVTVNQGAEGYRVLKRFDFATGQPEAQALVSTRGFDFAGQIVGEYGTGAPLGVRVQADAETTHWFDERTKQLQALADAQFPGRVNRIICRRCTSDTAMMLVNTWSDRDPGRLSLYDAATRKWLAVGAVREAIDPNRMALLDLHRVKARDGLELPVWVARPPGSDKAARPAVVFVHGGPWIRGWSWQWDADVQFLASRGYVVIAPEFRGSTGYGERHFRAGWKQWGLAMQDDLADAVAWAAAQGWVDPKRVCIAGASYGGYATLAGLARHPDVYRCGIAWAAVTDPRLLFDLPWINDLSQEARQHRLPALVGDPVKDAAALAAVAPVEQAKQIKAPVLLAFGGQDTRVPIEHGERMRAALRAAGHDPTWVVYPREWHGWYLRETRYDFARRVEEFLGQHLK
jgi:dipeptidyl aminopeptidase/acylaminoacyl peptidase